MGGGSSSPTWGCRFHDGVTLTAGPQRPHDGLRAGLNETFWLALALELAQRRSPSACFLLVAARRRDPSEGNPMNPNPTARLHARRSAELCPLLGVAFHAMLSFIPWHAARHVGDDDNPPSFFLADASFVAHSFRMLLFFIIAGYFARLFAPAPGHAGFLGQLAEAHRDPPCRRLGAAVSPSASSGTSGCRRSSTARRPRRPPCRRRRWAFPLTHLWFLYQLLWLYAGMLGAWRGRAAGPPCNPSWLGGPCRDRRHPLACRGFDAGWPLAAVLLSTPMWFPAGGIPTPDQSLIPQLPATVGYGMGFAFGWLLHRAPGALAALQARWVLHLLLAVASTGCAFTSTRRSRSSACPSSRS